MIHYWPQMVMISLLALSLGNNIAKDGELKTGSASRWSAKQGLIGAGIFGGLLYFGGFWA